MLYFGILTLKIAEKMQKQGIKSKKYTFCKKSQGQLACDFSSRVGESPPLFYLLKMR